MDEGPGVREGADRAGHWKEVRAIRLDQTVTWLEQAPATRLWFLEYLGKAPPGVELLDTWFRRWCGQTNPAFTAELLLAGRDDSAKAIAATVTQTPNPKPLLIRHFSNSIFSKSLFKSLID